MVLFGSIFKEARGCDSGAAEQLVKKQTRGLAQELCLASVLAPFFASDLTALTLPRIFASLPRDLARSLWLNSDRRGAYSKLATGASAALSALGVPTVNEDEDPYEIPFLAQIPFKLDLLVIGRPSAHLLQAASNLGLRVGPAITLTASPHYDVLNPSFAVWCLPSCSSLRERGFRVLTLSRPRGGERPEPTVCSAVLFCSLALPGAAVPVPCCLQAPTVSLPNPWPALASALCPLVLASTGISASGAMLSGPLLPDLT